MDAITDKHRLDMPTMQVKRIWKLKQVTICRFHWKISPFLYLKKNVEYEKRSDRMNWTFAIMKKNRTYLITIITDNYEELIQCSVQYCNRSWSTVIPACRISGDTHQVVLNDSIIDNPENHFLKSNILVLRFEFNIRETSRITVQPRASNDTCITDYPRMYAKIAYTQILDGYFDTNTYFALHDRKQTYYIHKAILAARSSYFRQYIRDNCMYGKRGEMKLDVKSKVMLCFIYFLYTGQANFKFIAETKEFEELLKKFGIKGIQALKQ